MNLSTLLRLAHGNGTTIVILPSPGSVQIIARNVSRREASQKFTKELIIDADPQLLEEILTTSVRELNHKVR